MTVRAWLLMLGVLAWQGTARAQAAPSMYETDPASYRLIADELKQLEQERAQLSLGGPIALTIVGGGTAAVGAGFLLLGLLVEAIDCDEPGLETDDFPDSCGDANVTPLIVIGAVGVVAGAVMLAIALPSLFTRIDQRRALGARIKELRRELDRSAIESGPRLARTSTVLRLRF